MIQLRTFSKVRTYNGVANNKNDNEVSLNLYIKDEWFLVNRVAFLIKSTHEIR